MEDANGSELKTVKDVCLSGRVSQCNRLVTVHLLIRSLTPSRRSSPDRPGYTKVQILRAYETAIAIKIISNLRQSDALSSVIHSEMFIFRIYYMYSSMAWRILDYFLADL